MPLPPELDTIRVYEPPRFSDGPWVPCLKVLAAPDVPEAGRLKQSLARWCYAKTPIDDLCREAADLGITGMNLVNLSDWPALRKYVIAPTMVQGPGASTIGWNKKEKSRASRKAGPRKHCPDRRSQGYRRHSSFTLFGARAGMSERRGHRHLH